MCQSLTNQRLEYTSYLQNDIFIDFNPLSFLLFSALLVALILSGTVEDFQQISRKYNAPVICLQETNLKDDQMTLKKVMSLITNLVK